MSSARNCRHPDIRNFDGVRCCLACGHALFDQPANTHSDPHTTNTKEYTYKRLNHDLGKQIRLLVLHRGSGSDPLTCDIIHVNLADNPIYEALSYTWATDAGDSSQCQDIMCGNSKISLTKNCKAALLTLRNRDRKRTLWVDSICIDQTSIEERNHQVALMDVIYSHAAQVLVYLGPGSLDSDVILDCLEGDAAASEMLAEDYRYLHNFLSMRWFDRVWVLQEVALAKLVLLYAGDKVIHWTAQSIQKMLDLCEEGRRKPPSIFNWTPASRKDEDILHCLHRSRECSSTDPRDKVFALLSLVSPEHQKWISADYSMPTEEVFFRVAEYLIMQHSRLDVLMYAQGPPRDGEIQMIPSWIPRWDVKLAEHPLVPQFSDREMQILSSCWFEEDGVPLMPQAHYQHQFSGPSSHLSIASNIFEIGQTFKSNSRISLAQTLAPQMTDELPFAIAKRNSADSHASLDLAKMFDVKMELNESYNSSCLRIRAHRLDKITESGWGMKIDDEELNDRSAHHQRWTTTIAATTTTAAPLVYRSHHTCKTCAQSATHPTSPSPSLTRLQAHLRNQFYDAFDSFGQSARKIIGPTRPISVFQTENSVGIAWQGFEKGDTVWALYGLPVPFILRKQGNHYVLVGQCYLLGALNVFHPCMYCGEAAGAWPICTEVVDIW